MDACRWCEQCGARFNPNQWERARYCSWCGEWLCKSSEPVRMGGEGPASAGRHLQAAGRFIIQRPAGFAICSVGAGAAALAISPLMVSAGTTIMVLGGIVAGLSGFCASKLDSPELEDGVRLGVAMVGVGALVYALSFVLLATGVVAVAGGAGTGVYAVAKAISNHRKTRRLIIEEPLLIMEGDTQ